MKRNFSFLTEIRKSILFLCIGIVFIASKCYEVKEVNQPASVNPNSIVHVRISVQNENDWESGDMVFGNGILGILIPDGWTVLDSVYYYATGDYHDSYTGGCYSQEGFFFYTQGVVNFLNSNYSPPYQYYWWGAQSNDEINMAYVDSGYVNIRIQTDAKPGDFNIKYILGDDNFWNKSTDNDQYTIITESKLLQIKVEDLHTSTLETAKNEHWEVYPNPSEGYVYIGLSGFTNETVLKVYDLNGNLHRTALLYEGLNYMNLNTLSSGQYIISLETASEVRTKRLMIL